MTEDPRITLAIDHLYAIGESDQAEAIESLRSRLQAAEAARDDWAGQCGHANAGEDIAIRRAEAAEASLARVTQLPNEIAAAMPSSARYIGSRDAFNGMLGGYRHSIEIVRAALAGGTSPEPTEPTEKCKEFYGGGMGIPFICRLPKCHEGRHGRTWPDGRAGPGPVDVASEPPNPPEPPTYPAATDAWVPYSAPLPGNDGIHNAVNGPITADFAFGAPVGEPLGPTEQEQR